MSSTIIQANYDELDAIAGRFNQQAEATTALYTNVMRGYQALEGGGWQGRGFAAFSSEMQGEIFPALQRLTHALEEARAVTLEASTIIRQAEEEAASLFQGGGYESVAGGDGDSTTGISGGLLEGAIAGALIAAGFGSSTLGIAAAPAVVGWLKHAGFDVSFFKIDLKNSSIFNPDIEFKFPFWQNSWVDKNIGTTNVKAIGGELGLGFGLTTNDGPFVGAYGDFYLAKITDIEVTGDQNLGFTDETEINILSAEGFAGYKDGSIGITGGINIISAERDIGVNIAGYNVGFSTEVGLKWEWGFQIGKETKLKMPFLSFGIEFGGAK